MLKQSNRKIYFIKEVTACIKFASRNTAICRPTKPIKPQLHVDIIQRLFSKTIFQKMISLFNLE